MQAKRIFSLLLVVVLTILCGVMSVGAQDNAASFEYAVEVDPSTAIVKDSGLYVKPGDIVDVSVTVTANPGFNMMTFDIVYDTAALAPVVNENGEVVFTAGDMFGEEKVSVYFDPNGSESIVLFFNGQHNADITETGTVVTLQFEVVEDFHGTTEITLDKYKKNVLSANNSYGSSVACNGTTLTTHNYGEPVIAEATCTTPATATYTCSTEGCPDNTLVIETAPALGHTPVVDAAKDPTCTETGLTEGTHCSVCNEVLVAQNTIPALGHTPVVDGAVDPTYSSTGKTEGTHCSVCGSVLVAQEIIPEKSSLWIWILVIALVVILGVGGFLAYWCGIKKNPLPFIKKKDNKDDKAAKENKTTKAKK